jgi:nucleoside-diphosphate-sugar epimerase
MTTLVTGATGFLGGALARRLVAEGHRVRILARPSSDLGPLAGLPVEVIHGALEDLASVRRAVAGAELIVHCAACSTDWAPWEHFYRANVLGAHHLATAAREVPALRRLIHVSTTDVYGYPRQPCAEDGPLRDVGLPYNRTKVLAEQAFWTAAEHGLPLTVVRPATIYGPRSKDFALEMGRLLRAGAMLHIDHGRAPGGFLYVDHAVDALVRIAATPAAEGRAYNLSDGTGHTWRQYVEALARELGVAAPRRSLGARTAFGVAAGMEVAWRLARSTRRPLLTRHVVYLMTRSQAFPSDRARRDLGFTPRISFEEGVARTARWLRAGGHCAA